MAKCERRGQEHTFLDDVLQRCSWLVVDVLQACHSRVQDSRKAIELLGRWERGLPFCEQLPICRVAGQHPRSATMAPFCNVLSNDAVCPRSRLCFSLVLCIKIAQLLVELELVFEQGRRRVALPPLRLGLRLALLPLPGPGPLGCQLLGLQCVEGRPCCALTTSIFEVRSGAARTCDASGVHKLSVDEPQLLQEASLVPAPCVCHSTVLLLWHLVERKDSLSVPRRTYMSGGHTQADCIGD